MYRLQEAHYLLSSFGQHCLCAFLYFYFLLFIYNAVPIPDALYVIILFFTIIFWAATYSKVFCSITLMVLSVIFLFMNYIELLLEPLNLGKSYSLCLRNFFLHIFILYFNLYFIIFFVLHFWYFCMSHLKCPGPVF